MEIIDFHTHCFPDELALRAIERVVSTSPGAKNRTDGTLAGLRRSMAASGITKSVVLPVATKASQVSAINRAALLLRAPDIVPFGALHPLLQTIADEVAFLKTNGIRGVKFHPEFQDFHIDDPAVFPLYEALDSAGLIAVFHTGLDPGPFTNDHSTPERLANVHKKFPSLPIVGGHMGGHQMWDEAEKHLLGLPIHLDTSTAPSNFTKEEFLRFCRRHDVGRILFGTDSPWYDQTYDREWIASCGFTEDEKDLVFHANAERLLFGLRR